VVLFISCLKALRQFNLMAKDDLYETLGVSRGASEDEISKSYKKLARTHHPDKGGNEDQFKKIQRAYDVLGEKKSREFYDMTGAVPGEDGAPSDGGGGMPFGGGPGGMPFSFGMNMADLFGMFGGGGGGRPQGPQRGPRRRPGKAPPRVERLPLSLAQLYNGGSLTICLNREKFCPTCKGDGSKVLKTCDRCGGSGHTVQQVMMGPGMMMHAQGPCGECHGRGEQRGDPCIDCKGAGLTRQTKNIEIIIQPGAAAGDVLTFDSEASDSPEFERGSDLNIVIETADDPNGWVRNGDNLRNEVHISLTESLCGCYKELSGHPGFGLIHVEVPRGIQNGQEIIVPGRGMPKRSGGPSAIGHLYLKVHVDVRDAEQRVLSERADTFASLFDYKREIPTGKHVFVATKSL
jgi:DnaJ-class molecular chaperone